MVATIPEIEQVKVNEYTEAVKNGLLLAIEYLLQKRTGETELPREIWLERELGRQETPPDDIIPEL